MEAERRKRMRRWGGAGSVRYLTFSCNGRLPLFGNPRVRGEFVGALGRVRDRHGFRLVAYVVMPDHVHLMVVVGESPLSAALWELKKPFADRVIARWEELRWEGLRRIRDEHGRPRFWLPGGGFDRLVRSEDELAREIDYIHLNPVRRGLVKRAVDWEWSSARWYAGEREGVLACG